MRIRVPAAAAAIAAAALASCGRETPRPPEARAPVQVAVVPAVLAPVADGFEAGGVVRAAQSAVLSSRIVAPVMDVLVRPGDRVRAGQVLVVLDSRQLDAEAGRAAAALDAAHDAQRVAVADRDAAAAAAVLSDQYLRPDRPPGGNRQCHDPGTRRGDRGSDVGRRPDDGRGGARRRIDPGRGGGDRRAPRRRGRAVVRAYHQPV